MKRIVGLVIISVLVFPLASLAGEPPWWSQKKRECGLPSGMAYNTWESQGSPCNKGGSSGALPAGQQLGTALGQAFGNAIAESIRKSNEEAAMRAAQAKIKAEEEKLRQEEDLLKKHDEIKKRLLGGMMDAGGSPQLGLMGVESGPGLTLMTDDLNANGTGGTFGENRLEPIIGDSGPVPLLRQPGELENQRGGRYVDCDATRRFYEKASTGLNSQKDAIERARTQIADAKKSRSMHSKELKKVLLKGAFDTARDMVDKSKLVQEHIDVVLKKGGLSDKQREVLYDVTKLLNDRAKKVKADIKKQEAGIAFTEEFKQAKGFTESFLAVNKLLADSGILEKSGGMLAESFGPLGVLTYDALKLDIDVAFVLLEKDVLDENDLQQAQETYDNLKYQLSQTEERLDNAKSDLTKHCGNGQDVVIAPLGQ